MNGSDVKFCDVCEDQIKSNPKVRLSVVSKNGFVFDFKSIIDGRDICTSCLAEAWSIASGAYWQGYHDKLEGIAEAESQGWTIDE